MKENNYFVKSHRVVNFGTDQEGGTEKYEIRGVQRQMSGKH